jgi:hypothetical protein
LQRRRSKRHAKCAHFNNCDVYQSVSWMMILAPARRLHAGGANVHIFWR